MTFILLRPWVVKFLKLGSRSTKTLGTLEIRQKYLTFWRNILTVTLGIGNFSSKVTGYI